MGIRKEIKAVIAEHTGSFTSANEAINIISNIISRPKPEKLFPKPKQLTLDKLSELTTRRPIPVGGFSIIIDEVTSLEDKCQARQHSDQMFCKQCGIGWDMNDPDPPQCGRDSVPLEDVLLPEITKEMFKKI